MTEAWTPEQFWEYAEGLTDSFVVEQLHDTMKERGLCLVPAQQTPDGWQLVPKEPTKEMIQACIWALDRWREKHGNVQGFVPPGDKHQVRWRAMLKSAPVFKATQQAEGDPAVTLDCAGAGTAFPSTEGKSHE